MGIGGRGRTPVYTRARGMRKNWGSTIEHDGTPCMLRFSSERAVAGAPSHLFCPLWETYTRTNIYLELNLDSIRSLLGSVQARTNS